MIIWGVSQVNRQVKQIIDDEPMFHDLWIEGEVSNFVVSMSGHAFFTLKDSGSQLRCVMFRGQLARIRKRPENGERCVARGALRVYEAQGTYQLYTEFVAPAGMGELQLRLEELRARLEAEGLFEPSRKRPLPEWPSRIGVVTSATGAVIHDIRNVVGRRWRGAEIVLAPTPVQGDDAPPLICQAIEDLNAVGNVDVIIVARGGGSIEDLWPFNDESVARAIFGSRAPIVSAIGHETDVTIADLVADRRAPTPSAAAELVVPDELDVRERLSGLASGMVWAMRRCFDRLESDLGQAELSLVHNSPAATIVARRKELVSLMTRATTVIRHDFELRSERLAARELQIRALDPQAILARGFSVTWRVDDEKVVRLTSDIVTGQGLRTRVADGTFDSVVMDR